MAASESFERALKKSIESNVLEGFDGVDKLSDKQKSCFFFSRLRRSWLRPTAQDVSAFGQHRKSPPHARKTTGTQGNALMNQWKRR